MIVGGAGNMPIGMPVEKLSYLIDGAVYVALEQASERIIPANKLLVEKMISDTLTNVTQGGVSPASGRCFVISFPAGSCSPGDKYQGDTTSTAALAGTLRPSGGVTKFIRQLKCDHATIRYFVRFPVGFDWRRGGKLPGLSSADVSASGGDQSTAGISSFTARLMWQSGGYITPYLYMADNVDRWGTTHGSSLGSSMQIGSGSWIEIVQEVKLNDVGQENGRCKITINGDVLCDKSDLLWRINSDLKIDGVYLCTFFGGHTFGYADDTYETLASTSLEISDIVFYAR